MKNHSFYIAITAILAAFCLTSCVKDDCSRTVSYIRVDPVYLTLEELHSGTLVKESPRELKNPGQIYYYNQTMFVVEKKEGIHVINNSNPSNPVNLEFLAIPGNEDLAIKDGLLYANSYTDLLVIDLQSYEVVGRVESILQPYWEDLANNRVLVDYVETPVTEVLDCDDQALLYMQNGVFYRGGAGLEVDVLAGGLSNDFAGAPSGTGIAGSLARFSIIGEYLYTIQFDGFQFEIFDLTAATEPVHAGSVNVGVHLQTLFPYEDKLFIGSNVGMYIYDNSDPLNPVQLGSFEHVRACDPVYVSGDYAYVTLWDGSTCGSGPNQLDVIDITDLTNPVLKKSFSMQNPHGLSVKEDVLLLCEGMFGFKTFDNTDPLTVGDNLLDHEQGLHALDVISLPGPANVAMVIGEDGFYQFGFDDPANLELLSVIPVVGQ